MNRPLPPPCSPGLLPFVPGAARGRAGLLSTLLKTAFDQSSSDLAAWYALSPRARTKRFLPKEAKGIYPVPPLLTEEVEWVDFILESGEALILNRPRSHFLGDLLLHSRMHSAMALPLFDKGGVSDIVILNSSRKNHYGRGTSRDLLALGQICSNFLKGTQ